VSINNETIRLQNIKSTIDRGRTETARAGATLEALAKQESDIHRQLAELGVAPEVLDAEIEALKSKFAEHLSRAETLLASPAQGA